MPTGYTDAIEKGITFREFALFCARAFGACITMKEDSADKEIPLKFEPSTYHKNQIQKITAEREALSKITEDEASKLSEEERKAKFAEIEGYIEKASTLRQKYMSMLTKVKAWEPPTEDHKGLKKFMIDQIMDSIDHDCNVNYYEQELENLTKPISGKEWLSKKKVAMIKSISYHIEEDAEEQTRTAARTVWIQQLRASLSLF